MKLLVVEDELRLAEVVSEGMREVGYRVDVASDGERGLAMALAGAYDVVILDVMLPLRDGIEVCRELRRHEVDSAIIMLTARDALEDKIRGLECGADDYVTKPFDFPELIARVRSQLRRSSRGRSDIVTVGDLIVDTRTHHVTRSGRPIQLTSREYALLEYLARNAGRVLTRDQILANVWPADHEGYSNTVDVFIRYLRRKLEPEGEPKLIRTVIRFGYTLKAS